MNVKTMKSFKIISVFISNIVTARNFKRIMIYDKSYVISLSIQFQLQLNGKTLYFIPVLWLFTCIYISLVAMVLGFLKIHINALSMTILLWTRVPHFMTTARTIMASLTKRQGLRIQPSSSPVVNVLSKN